MVHMGGALFHFSIIASLIPRPQTAFAQLGTRLYMYILFMGKMMYSNHGNHGIIIIYRMFRPLINLAATVAEKKGKVL